ncbi:IS630 family transposase [Deinococcus sp. YIM 134068]|uniref:IS630 family transposase n=1 Tax=Deinococcus lichenicola TaxID=3118910 RepID=UPI002F945846
MQQHPADQLVFVDESSTHLAMTPLYARTPRGKRAYGAVPRNKGANISLLAALTRQGMTAALTVPGAVDGIVFERYIEHVLLPELSPGQTVVMDNLSVHKRARVAQLLHDHGCTLRFLPTSSPDLAPIEGGFSKVKTLVRRDQPRTREALDQSIGRALAAVSTDDAQGWFQRCGYLLTRQPL